MPPSPGARLSPASSVTSSLFARSVPPAAQEHSATARCIDQCRALPLWSLNAGRISSRHFDSERIIDALLRTMQAEHTRRAHGPGNHCNLVSRRDWITDFPDAQSAVPFCARLAQSRPDGRTVNFVTTIALHIRLLRDVAPHCCGTSGPRRTPRSHYRAPAPPCLRAGATRLPHGLNASVSAHDVRQARVPWNRSLDAGALRDPSQDIARPAPAGVNDRISVWPHRRATGTSQLIFPAFQLACVHAYCGPLIVSPTNRSLTRFPLPRPRTARRRWRA